ncbi:hypothetical protein [Pedobacter cryophilus]|uniref:Uncharacterized protein n=1 Tax=Pedobacter cryophilus TaxID=2571271 RepID=A0A4U1C205_9SPHI|nr:hypothetical protein [Pedobacter cryophilus]TKB99037.1 hypothetical protein FA046_07950 [Pedobacter cryophilus]
MKFEQIKNPTKKLAKGFAGIFVIKLVILAIILVVQSCQKESLPQSKNQLIAKQNFLNSINGSLKSFDKLTITSKSSSSGIKVNSDDYFYQNDYATVSLYSESGYSSNNSEIFFGSLFDIPNTDVGVIYNDATQSGNITPDQTLIISYDMPIQAAEQLMQPTLIEAKNYLYAQGYTESDIQEVLAADEEGPVMEESALIPAVMILVAEQENLSGSTNFNMITMFGSEARASQIGDCAGDALGVSAVAIALQSGLNTSTGKALLSKAIRKVASRSLGWIGAAIFAYEFGDCMGWWN